MMNDETIQPENNDVLTKFEQRMRSQSLGPGPTRRAELMYECGYAAGAAASRNKAQRLTTRWRVFSMVASVLACVSLSSHFFSTDFNDIEQFSMDEQVKPSQQHPIETSPEPTPNAWIMHLTRERQSDQQTVGTLRFSEATQNIAKPDSPDDTSSPFPFSTQNTPLRPTDFTLFL